MKNMKLFFALFVIIAFNATLFAQNGNMVISEVQVYDLGNGTGLVEIRISGNLAYTATSGSFTVAGVEIPGGQVTSFLAGTRPVKQPGNQSVILTGSFPLSPIIGNGPGFVELDIQVQGAIFSKSKEKDSFKIFRYR